MKQEVWECDRCGKKDFPVKGEQILAEYLCMEGARKQGGGIAGACMGTVRRITPSDRDQQ